ncbi:DUF6380 family protein [Streptomyces sp. V3I8]
MDTSAQDDAGPWKRDATLWPGTASLTATAARAPFHRRGGAAGEGAR